MAVIKDVLTTSKKIQWTVEMADSQIKKWTTIKEVIARSQEVLTSDNLYTRVYKLYLKYTSVAEVAQNLNNQGFRVPGITGQRKFTTNDVSEIIRTENIPDAELQCLVREILADATRFINKLWN